MSNGYDALWRVLRQAVDGGSGPDGTGRSSRAVAVVPMLSLAYLGDAVYEAYVRARLVTDEGGRPRRLHEGAVARVRAAAQARVLDKLEPQLTDVERDLLRRARNARPGHMPRSVKAADYHRSTAFEALLGHLLLAGDTERLGWVLAESWQQGSGLPEAVLEAPSPELTTEEPTVPAERNEPL